MFIVVGLSEKQRQQCEGWIEMSPMPGLADHRSGGPTVSAHWFIRYLSGRGSEFLAGCKP